MNKNIQKLIQVASKSSRLAIGLMSGTSLDGLDIALCEIKGNGLETTITIKEFTTIAYDTGFKLEVKAVFSKKNIDLRHLCLLNEAIGIKHAEMVNECMQQWKIKKEQIDFIASHGQTIFHSPKSLLFPEYKINGTLQIGDGDHIAVKTGIITISDFRQKHVAAGGEGAPLAVYGDYLLFSKEGEERILLNIGGISNFTYLPGNLKAAEIICSDTGPGNTLMDALIQQHFPGKHFDEHAAVARQGNINHELLTALKDDVFFKIPFPKTTGPELFNLNYLHAAKDRSGTNSLGIEDTLCTLTKFSADNIAEAINSNFRNNENVCIYTSGGGVHNPLLMQFLQAQLPGCTFFSTKHLGIDPDAKEAVLFAILANECICGSPEIFSVNGDLLPNMPAITMGKISFPG